MATSDTLRITKNCRGCGKELHLVQDSTGSMWMHDRAADEWACWQDNRAAYEAGDL